jgi:hypothetical protein
MNLFVRLLFFVLILSNCKLLQNDQDQDNCLNHSERDKVKLAIKKIEELHSKVITDMNTYPPEKEISLIVRSSGIKLIDDGNWFSMIDFCRLIECYENYYGRDSSFYSATKLAHMMSDGENAGVFESYFADVINSHKGTDKPSPPTDNTHPEIKPE